MKLEHIGIAVENLQESETIFEELLQTKVYKREEVPSQGVTTSFLQVKNTKVELLNATDPNSPIARFIDKRGEGMHHIAFEVDNIVDELQRLKAAGFKLINETPAIGADHKKVAFLHPRSTNRVLIELCQDIQDDDDI
ncbi:methylmalonyl-CoA epimerase [Membranicola marinus]|uniref:Methylmalonyl-CoA epimerase n=1 Tax=Membranihabitans marinus TaxID=1227546 RepID=A0A953HVI9_9BACT|nr:methylmalonyl-CoA epimerase [Membranihabitans marinus]MBY5957316.1 methylmalonyl-CoA epimerase [Membranihabitans marinus]